MSLLLGLVPTADRVAVKNPFRGAECWSLSTPWCLPVLPAHPQLCSSQTPSGGHAFHRAHTHECLFGVCPVVAEVCRRGLSLYQSTKCLPLEGIQAGRFPKDLENPGIKLQRLDALLQTSCGLPTSPGSGGCQPPMPQPRLQGTEGSWAPWLVKSHGPLHPVYCPCHVGCPCLAQSWD